MKDLTALKRMITLVSKQTVFAVLILTSLMTPAIAAEPFINNMIPGFGAVGTDVFIEGGNFVFGNVSSNKVKFGGTRASVLEATDPTRLKVKVPANATNGPVTIMNSNSNWKEIASPNDFVVTPPVPSNRGAIGRGDRILLKTGVYGFMLPEGRCLNSDGFIVNKDPRTQYDAPSGSVLSVVADADKDENITVSFSECRLWGLFEGGCSEPTPVCNGVISDKVVKGNAYKIALAKIQAASIVSIGLDYGTLAIPFKFQLSDHNITGNSSVVQYLGYKVAWGAMSFMPVVSAGLGVVSVTQQSGTTTSSSSAPSFSVAYGVVLDVLKNGLFQTGILAGRDWAGKDSQYKYEGKTWISISIGTNWTN